MTLFYPTLAILFLYLTHRKVVSELSHLVGLLGGTRKTLILIWSLVFLPGTLIHELSHFLVATAIGVRTGKIKIFPEYLESSTLGYVQVAKMNLFQGFLVGTAPLVFGISILIWLAPLITNYYQVGNLFYLSLTIYLFFTVANSLFPSWSDIQQTIPLVILTLIFLGSAWLFGFPFYSGHLPALQKIFSTISTTTFFSGLLNILIVGILFLANTRLR